MSIRWEITIDLGTEEDLSTILDSIEERLLQMQTIEQRIVLKAITSRSGTYERRYNERTGR